MRLTEVSQSWLKSSLVEGDVVIDATLGNGFDALFLAEHIGDSGHLYGFDVQAGAIDQSKQLLSSKHCEQTFFLRGHQHMEMMIPLSRKGKVKVIMFNLGWLPGSDKRIITHAATTIVALEQSIMFLAQGGKLSVMVYPGHDGGETEAMQVIQWLTQTCSQSKNSLSFEKIAVLHRPTAPILLQVEKLVKDV